MYNQAESFIQEFRRDNDDVNSINEFQDNEDHIDIEEQKGIFKMRRKKKYVNIIENNIHIIFVKLFIGVIILECYFVYNYL